MIFSDEPVLLPNCSWLFEVVVVLLTLTPNAPPLALMAFDACSVLIVDVAVKEARMLYRW